MKPLAAFIALLAMLTSCSRQETVSVNATSNVLRSAEPAQPETPSPATTVTQTATPTPAGDSVAPPIEFTYLGLTPDKQHIHYRIKILAANPIEQVDLGVKYMDGAGKVLDETTLLWQNIVKSKRQPIERGKTYEVEDYMPEGTATADLVLKRVVFADGTYWKSQ